MAIITGDTVNLNKITKTTGVVESLDGGTVLTINGIEQTPEFIPFNPNDPLASGFGGDYTLLLGPKAFNISPTISFQNSVMTLKNLSNGDEIYGDLTALNLIAIGTAHNEPETPSETDGVNWNGSDYKPFYTGVNGYTINMGNDKITVKQDVNLTIAGDLKILDLYAEGPAISEGANNTTYTRAEKDLAVKGQDSEGVIGFNTFNMGDDVIKAAGGDKLVAGDILEVTIVSRDGVFNPIMDGDDKYPSGFNQALIFFPNVYNMGNDVITLTGGKNIVSGDIMDLTLDSGSIPPNLAAGQTSGEGASIADSEFAFGNDSITTGDAVDHLYGDVRSVLFHGENGDHQNGISGLSGSIDTVMDFGDDTLTANGGDDFLFGDVGNFTVEMFAGDVINGTAYQGGSTNPVNLMISDSSARFNFNTVLVGNDVLDGGDGNDHLYGDIQNLVFDLRAGDIHVDVDSASDGIPHSSNGTSASATASNNIFIMGSDVLSGGVGDDVLIGDIEHLAFNAADGDIDPGIVDATALASFSSGFGNATSITGSIPRPEAGWQFRFGNDVLNGGDGNDLIIGDTVEIEDLRNFLESSIFLINDDPAITQNRIRFGNDTLTGGEGEDTFGLMLFGSFGNQTLDLLVSQGIDTFTDFNLDDDTLALTIFDPENRLDLSTPSDLSNLNGYVTFDLVDADGDGAEDDTAIFFNGVGLPTIGGGEWVFLNHQFSSFEYLGDNVTLSGDL